MLRRLMPVLVLLAASVPLSASQFIQLPFDQVAREATLIVRGQVVGVYSAWNDAHDTIFSYATVRVQRYMGETTGPDVLMVREAGGTVGEYTQQAIGFPELREGEQVVLMLTKWDGSDDWRIHAYNQGKYLVHKEPGPRGIETLSEDPVKQGDERLEGGHPRMQPRPLMEMKEFEEMAVAAREGRTIGPIDRRN